MEDVDANNTKIIKERDLISESPNGLDSLAVGQSPTKARKARDFLNEIEKMRSKANEME